MKTDIFGLLYSRGFCVMCKKKLPKSHGNRIRCGNERKKIGCAYKAYIERNKAWKSKTKYWEKPSRRIKARTYYKAYDIKRGRVKQTIS